MHMSSSPSPPSPAPTQSKIIRLKRTEQERSDSAFNRLDGGMQPPPPASASASSVRSRLDGGDVADRLGPPSQAVQSSTTRNASAPAKKKSYVLVRTLKDGTKIREKISEDDPILDKVTNYSQQSGRKNL